METLEFSEMVPLTNSLRIVPAIVILTYLCKVKTKTPRGGKVTLASEEGLIRNLANRVISDGSSALDAELGHFQAAGQIISPGSSQTGCNTH